MIKMYMYLGEKSFTSLYLKKVCPTVVIFYLMVRALVSSPQNASHEGVACKDMSSLRLDLLNKLCPMRWQSSGIENNSKSVLQKFGSHE
jgi:hypothetical protein